MQGKILTPNESFAPSAWERKTGYSSEMITEVTGVNGVLIETCKLNGINPEACLRHILLLLPEWPANRVSELLLWNVELATK